MDATLRGKTAVFVGGSRGLGRAAVDAVIARGARAVVIGRDPRALAALADAQPGVVTVTGDAGDEALATQILAEHRPALVVLVAGRMPTKGPVHELSWEDFSASWHADTRYAFVWLGQALRQPLAPGSHIIVGSSGAAIGGSPVSGGYAAAKRAQWFIASYAAAEVERARLGIRIHCLLPGINPHTELGRAGIAAYARRNGISDEEFIGRLGPTVTPAIFGAAVADLAAGPERWPQLAYRVGAEGLAPV
jgi:NAD(P)-dependent dehydrogenase (short-subunit alcohol dehydrogenase family)